MAKSKYPRTLFRKDKDGKLSFTNKTYRDVRYDSLLVYNAEEQTEAEKMGYIDNFADAIVGYVEEPVVKKEEVKDDF
jgi:hypothetical protein